MSNRTCSPHICSLLCSHLSIQNMQNRFLSRAGWFWTNLTHYLEMGLPTRLCGRPLLLIGYPSGTEGRVKWVAFTTFWDGMSQFQIKGRGLDNIFFNLVTTFGLLLWDSNLSFNVQKMMINFFLFYMKCSSHYREVRNNRLLNPPLNYRTCRMLWHHVDTTHYLWG